MAFPCVKTQLCIHLPDGRLDEVELFSFLQEGAEYRSAQVSNLAAVYDFVLPAAYLFVQILKSNLHWTALPPFPCTLCLHILSITAILFGKDTLIRWHVPPKSKNA